MTDIKFPTPPETIYLVPDTDEGIPNYLWCEDPAPGLEMDADEAIEYTRKSDWISVEDRLPITESHMIKAESNYMTIDVICFDGELVYQGEFRAGNTNEFWCGFDFPNITKWQPLPAPPPQEKG